MKIINFKFSILFFKIIKLFYNFKNLIIYLKFNKNIKQLNNSIYK